MKPTKNQSVVSGFLIFLLIIGAYAVGFIGWGSPKAGGGGETTSWNAGTSSCAITAGSLSCTNTFTWPTPLAAIPCTGCSQAGATTATGGISDLTINYPPSQENFWATGNDFATAGRWVNMPAAQTEIFGDNSQHWLVEDWANAATADFVIDCPVASNTVGASLTVQYSTNQGGTWTSITASNIIIDNTICANLVPVDSGISNGGTWGSTFTIPAGAQASGVFLRIVGAGGGGVGDVPQFVYAYLLVYQPASSVKFFFNARIFLATATQIGVIGVINVPQSSSTTVNWKMSAWICITGGSGSC